MEAEMKVLIGEDNSDDAELLRVAWRFVGPRVTPHIVSDGQEVVDYLQGTGRYGDRQQYPLPDLLLTDLKMPRMGGFDVLRWMREHPEHGATPTIVLSSSGMPEDIKRAYELGAKAYMVKPTTLRELREAITAACGFWSRCERPTDELMAVA